MNDIGVADLQQAKVDDITLSTIIARYTLSNQNQQNHIGGASALLAYMAKTMKPANCRYGMSPFNYKLPVVAQNEYMSIQFLNDNPLRKYFRVEQSFNDSGGFTPTFISTDQSTPAPSFSLDNNPFIIASRGIFNNNGFAASSQGTTPFINFLIPPSNAITIIARVSSVHVETPNTIGVIAQGI